MHASGLQAGRERSRFRVDSVEPAEGRVEVGAGQLKRSMAEHVLHVVDRPTVLVQARARFVPKVMKAQIDPPDMPLPTHDQPSAAIFVRADLLLPSFALKMNSPNRCSVASRSRTGHPSGDFRNNHRAVLGRHCNHQRD